MTTNIILRPMVADDIPIVVDWMLNVPLWQRYDLQRARATTNFQDALERGDLLYVADVEIAACGVAWCQLKGMFGFLPYLKILGVHPDYHSRNIGGQLLAHIEQLAQPQKAMFLLVADFNTAAQRFYQRLGYQQIGSAPHLVLPDVNELIFWKSL